MVPTILRRVHMKMNQTNKQALIIQPCNLRQKKAHSLPLKNAPPLSTLFVTPNSFSGEIDNSYNRRPNLKVGKTFFKKIEITVK